MKYTSSIKRRTRNKRPSKTPAITARNNRVCSPAVKVKGVVDASTCLTPKILILIKDEFNKLTPNDQITAKTLKGIWNELVKKMHCDCASSFDDCWYNKIPNKELRDKIAKYIFAPTHPKSWNKNPNEWLSNFDILKVLKQYETTYPTFKFFEPTTIDFDHKLSADKCVSDELCKIDIQQYIKQGKTEFGFIFNLDNYTGGGTHWVSFYLSTKDRFAFFFDSVGDPIPTEVKRLKKRICEQVAPMSIKFYQNAPFNHQRGNNECGTYSLYFITTMLTKRLDNTPIALNTLIKYFKGQHSGRITDAKMNHLRWEIFNKPR